MTEWEYFRRLLNCIPWNVRVGLIGEDTAQEILTRLLPPGYIVERKAPSLLSKGNCDFIIKDPTGRTVGYVEVKNWANYRVSLETVNSQVLNRFIKTSGFKLLITPNKYLANYSELERNGLQAAYTETQLLPTSDIKDQRSAYLVWKVTIAIELSKLGLYHDPFRTHKPTNQQRIDGIFTLPCRTSTKIEADDACASTRVSVEIEMTEEGWEEKHPYNYGQHARVIVSEIDRLRFSLVDAFLHSVPLDLFW